MIRVTFWSHAQQSFARAFTWAMMVAIVHGDGGICAEACGDGEGKSGLSKVGIPKFVDVKSRVGVEPQFGRFESARG